jgi:ribosomal protein S18 acetylase RimI-like enzyme
MNPILKIRAAQPADANFAASMLYLSMEHLADHLFRQDKDAIEAVIAQLFARDAGRFGYRIAFVSEFEGQQVGLLIASRGDRLDRLNLETAPHLFSVLGLKTAVGFVLRGVRLPGGKEAEDDEYFISNLGILPAMQGRSFGSQMLAFAEELTCGNNLKKCSLIVGGYNKDARRLYERIGYQVVETVNAEKADLGYYRMVKVL